MSLAQRLSERIGRASAFGLAMIDDARRIPHPNGWSGVLGDPSLYALALLRSGAALRALTGRSFGTTLALRVFFHIDVFSDAIAGGLRLPHPFGIVIGEGAEVGEGCTVMQHVTVQRGGAAIGARAVLATGSTVLQGAVVGEGAFIGAGSVVRGSIPARSVAVGVPARVVRSVREGEVRT